MGASHIAAPAQCLSVCLCYGLTPAGTKDHTAAHSAPLPPWDGEQWKNIKPVGWDENSLLIEIRTVTVVMKREIRKWNRVIKPKKYKQSAPRSE